MVAIAGTVGPSRCRRSNNFFSETGLHLRFQCISRAAIHVAFGALVANSSTCDVASTYWTEILCSRARVRMYIARHL